MDKRTRLKVAASLRAAASKLLATKTKNVKAAVELSPDEKNELRKALTDAVQRTISSPRFLQQLNEDAEFPERFNRIGDDYATITAVVVENNGTRVVFTLGDEEWSYQLGAFSVDRV
jgi:hypothetical protein